MKIRPTAVKVIAFFMALVVSSLVHAYDKSYVFDVDPANPREIKITTSIALNSDLPSTKQYVKSLQEQSNPAAQGQQGTGYKYYFTKSSGGGANVPVIGVGLFSDLINYNLANTSVIPGYRYSCDQTCYTTAGGNQVTYTISANALKDLARNGAGVYTGVIKAGFRITSTTDKKGRDTSAWTEIYNSNFTITLRVGILPPRILTSTSPVDLTSNREQLKPLCFFDGTADGTFASSVQIKLDDNNTTNRSAGIFSINRGGITDMSGSSRYDFEIWADNPGNGQQYRKQVNTVTDIKNKSTRYSVSDGGDVAGLPQNFNCLHWNLRFKPKNFDEITPGNYRGVITVTYTVVP